MSRNRSKGRPVAANRPCSERFSLRAGRGAKGATPDRSARVRIAVMVFERAYAADARAHVRERLTKDDARRRVALRALRRRASPC
jgi:hypothetical protein